MKQSSEWKSFHVRPEDEKTAVDYYDASEAERYAKSNAMRKIQEQLTLRAVELAQFPLGSKIIDAGCGSGFSSIILREIGYEVYPFDLIPAFVEQCKQKGFKAKVGDLCKFPFKGKFDGIVSISVLQWVSIGGMVEVAKVAREFWNHLKKGGKAVIQFYPKSEVEAMQCGKAFKEKGFAVKIITDNPANSRKRKVFILLEKP
ncbi:MAG: class I SAM-dependent methyltransferase [Candidatus Micrarchaeota archaeon]|nr:class I SAM-dependent methyltransferase [Candidatus Micrarchaeota archaeon]